MRNCLVGVAPSYLRSFCTFVSSIPSRASLRSSTQGLMVVPRMRSATAHSRCFAYVGPSAWNSLPHSLLLELLALSPSQFRRRLKTFLFPGSGSVVDRERCWYWAALYKCLITITITITNLYCDGGVRSPPLIKPWWKSLWQLPPPLAMCWNIYCVISVGSKFKQRQY